MTCGIANAGRSPALLRRNPLAMGVAGLAAVGGRKAAASAGQKARFFMVVSGTADGPEAQSWAALTGALRKRGFPSTLVPSIFQNASFTPRAEIR